MQIIRAEDDASSKLFCSTENLFFSGQMFIQMLRIEMLEDWAIQDKNDRSATPTEWLFESNYPGPLAFIASWWIVMSARTHENRCRIGSPSTLKPTSPFSMIMLVLPRLNFFSVPDYQSPQSPNPFKKVLSSFIDTFNELAPRTSRVENMRDFNSYLNLKR